MSYNIAALYHFAPVAEKVALQSALKSVCAENDVLGSLLLADEGINGTIASPGDGIHRVIAYIRAQPHFGGLEAKFSTADKKPFRRMKVRLKKEIVTMGVPLVDPTNLVGKYLDPAEWHTFLQQDDVVVVDTRNDYEVAIGSFKNAINPDIKSFREFPKWWAENKDRFHNKRVAMFCTGGIRCEKSTSHAIAEGDDEIYHLKGGILKYLEEIPKEHSLWQGDCFVFDHRVSVGHGLSHGKHFACFACGRPITADDTTRAEYEKGVSCHHCIDEYDDERKTRFRERQKQIALAAARGERHGFVSEF